jgi:thymidylate synthase (FAD)
MKQSDKLYLYPDGIGYVQVIDFMGDSYTPAEDARTSTDKGRLGPAKDEALQERLMKDNHTSPFEGVVVKAEMVVPLFVLREMDRHRTVTKIADHDAFDEVSPEESGRKWFSRNEMSGRYIQLPDSYYHPEDVRGQSTSNKQGGSVDSLDVSPDVAEEFLSRGKALTKASRELYDWAVQFGIEKGQARIYNTLNQYVKIRMTGSLKNWLDFLKLRLPNDVLWECRRVAEDLHELLHDMFPTIVNQWEDHVLDAFPLSCDEAASLQVLMEDLENHPAYIKGDPVLEGLLTRLKRGK